MNTTQNDQDCGDSKKYHIFIFISPYILFLYSIVNLSVIYNILIILLVTIKGG